MRETLSGKMSFLQSELEKRRKMGEERKGRGRRGGRGGGREIEEGEGEGWRRKKREGRG